jgi:3-oxoacyl-[acyl-carrier protein] reductase
MKVDLTGRTALVTGASRGIGEAIARRLAETGAHVLCAARNLEQVERVAAEITASGGSATAVQLDITSADVRDRIKALIEQRAIDILVNNAGITRDGLIARMSEDDWNAVIQTNLTSAFHWTKAIGWPMCRARYGRIVNIASVIGLVGNAGQANYAAAKGGMIAFTKSVAKEFAKRGVTANVVAPGFIKTDMTAGLSEEVQKAAASLIPMQRFGEPADIAAATAFLCSEEASYITGQVFTVDGGMAM